METPENKGLDNSLPTEIAIQAVDTEVLENELLRRRVSAEQVALDEEVCRRNKNPIYNCCIDIIFLCLCAAMIIVCLL